MNSNILTIEVIIKNIITELINDFGYCLEQIEVRTKNKSISSISIWRTIEDYQDNNLALIVIDINSEAIKENYNHVTWVKAKKLMKSNRKETKIFKIEQENKKLILTDCLKSLKIPNYHEIKKDEAIKKLMNQIQVFEIEEFANFVFQCQIKVNLH